MFKRVLISVLEVIEIAFVTVGTVFLIRSFLIQPFVVSGSSMIPNFSDRDYLLIDELTYRFRDPQRGEAVVFHSPGNESVYFIKRLIGLPGERVVIKSGAITLYTTDKPNGLTLSENYLAPGTVTSGDIDVLLKANEYFVLGDNRSSSYDSREWGVLNGSEIVGIARLRLWPLDSLHAFAAPTYNVSVQN